MDDQCQISVVLLLNDENFNLSTGADSFAIKANNGPKHSQKRMEDDGKTRTIIVSRIGDESRDSSACDMSLILRGSDCFC